MPADLAQNVPRFVLASASATRLRGLRQAGLDPTVAPSDADEDGIEGLTPEAAVTVLARRKAEVVARRFPQALVLGCDTMVDQDGALYGKPISPAEATMWLRAWRGQTATVWTGHHLVIGERAVSAATSARVRFGRPSDAEIDRYVSTGEPLGAAGAFCLDGRAVAFVDEITGDPGTIHGVSMPVLRRLLAELDVELTDLWC
jgi:septum formation protein